jgi:nucleoid DNA-binding protein
MPHKVLPQCVTKLTIDARTAALLGMSRKEVAAITDAFLKEAVSALASEGALKLNGFGEFHITSHEGKRINLLQSMGSGNNELCEIISTRRNKVFFRKAPALYRAIIAELGKPRSKIRRLNNGEVRSRYRHR